MHHPNIPLNSHDKRSAVACAIAPRPSCPNCWACRINRLQCAFPQKLFVRQGIWTFARWLSLGGSVKVAAEVSSITRATTCLRAVDMNFRFENWVVNSLLLSPPMPKLSGAGRSVRCARLTSWSGIRKGPDARATVVGGDTVDKVVRGLAVIQRLPVQHTGIG
jgi:hypothetical protein